jgi:hypothetical protein
MYSISKISCEFFVVSYHSFENELFEGLCLSKNQTTSKVLICGFVRAQNFTNYFIQISIVRRANRSLSFVLLYEKNLLEVIQLQNKVAEVSDLCIRAKYTNISGTSMGRKRNAAYCIYMEILRS